MFTQLAISTSYVIFLAFVQKHSLQNHPPHIHTPPYPPHLPHLPHQEINSKRTTLSFCNTRTLTASAFTQPTSQHVPCSWPVIRRLCPLHLPLPSRLLHHAYDVGFQPNQAVKIQWGTAVAAAIWEFSYAYTMRKSGKEYYRRMETQETV